MWLLPLGAAIVSALFSWQLARQWVAKRRPNLLAWSVALAMFAVASLAPALAMVGHWTPALFRTYYLFGAIVNVPVLGLGTIYLLGSRNAAHLCAIVVALASIVAVVVVWQAPVEVAALHTNGIPRGSEVMPAGVRLLARVYSFAGFFVVIGGAVWSAARLWRQRRQELRRLAVANGLIAAGTFVVALGSGFAFYGQGLPFAVGLFVGVCLMFWGFLKTRGRTRTLQTG